MKKQKVTLEQAKAYTQRQIDDLERQFKEHNRHLQTMMQQTDPFSCVPMAETVERMRQIVTYIAGHRYALRSLDLQFSG